MAGIDRISIKTLAAHCGVSIGSVDRALHNRPDINPATRDMILKKAAELGYRPNLPARSLVTGRTNTIGIVAFDLTHHFTAQLVSAIIQRLREDGYMSSVTVSAADIDEEKRCLEQLWSLNVDGIIIVPINKGKHFDEYLTNLNKPIVTILNRVSTTWPYVGVDYRKASADAVEFAVSRGYRRVLYLCPDYPRKRTANSYALSNLVTGYEKAVESARKLSAPAIINGTDYLEQLGQIDFSKRRTAVLCADDTLALETLTFLSSRGLRIPDDLGLMGFDNITTLEYVHPRLSTVDCMISEIGRRSAECILGEFAEERISPVVKHRIIPGETM